MALVPCNVCGTLNSEDAEICLSCEYPIKGRRRPILFQWAAILLFSLFTVPLIQFALGAIRSNHKPKRSWNLPIILHLEAEKENAPLASPATIHQGQ